mmetsp:Transcript_22749/g.63972  ORF Transcript_22749/g.63972 Transcript_22749/m.63972 type:complete len:210 (-) Transcript_22749:614-1243(-)
MATTFGSFAASSTSLRVLRVKDSYGWCTRMSPSRMALKMDWLFLALLRAVSARGIIGLKGGYSMPSGRATEGFRALSAAKSRSPSVWYTSVWASSSSSSTSRSTRSSGVVVSTSSLTKGANWRMRTSSEIMSNRSSASSSWRSISAFRVTRNTYAPCTSHPPKSRPRLWMMMRSRAMYPLAEGSLPSSRFQGRLTTCHRGTFFGSVTIA